MLSRSDLNERARRVRLLSCDVDGVLTDGRVYVDDDGRESKAFCALDGVGVHMLADAGIVVAWITSRSAPADTNRAPYLGVPHVVLNACDNVIVSRNIITNPRIATIECRHISR